jgi:hypothetical protein
LVLQYPPTIVVKSQQVILQQPPTITLPPINLGAIILQTPPLNTFAPTLLELALVVFNIQFILPPPIKFPKEEKPPLIVELHIKLQ